KLVSICGQISVSRGVIRIATTSGPRSRYGVAGIGARINQATGEGKLTKVILAGNFPVIEPTVWLENVIRGIKGNILCKFLAAAKPTCSRSVFEIDNIDSATKMRTTKTSNQHHWTELGLVEQ